MTDEQTLREFLIVLRRAMLAVCEWIAHKYGLNK